MNPYDVLGWMLVGFFAAFLVLTTWVTVEAVRRIKREEDEA